MRVAFLGLGRMGKVLAQRLLQGGHELTVWNRTPGRADDLLKEGANEAGTSAEAVSAADVVMTSLPNDEAVRQVALGPEGVRSVIGARIYVDTSTVSPVLTAELAEAFERFVALPVLGAPHTVVHGQATFLAGGPSSLVEELRPLLDSLGGTVKQYPRPELASSGKLAINVLLLAGVVAVAEALTVGRAGGLDDDQLEDLIGDSPQLPPGLKPRLKALLQGEGPSWWTTTLGAKDARLAVESAQSAGKELRLVAVVRDLYQAAADAGLDDEDIVTVAQLYR